MVVVAVIERCRKATPLQALTAAALLLPGLQATAQPVNSISVQASRFEEGKRHTAIDTGLTPLQAWTLDMRGSRALTDNLQLDFGLAQDSWSGATPVTVAPVALGGNRARRINSNGSTVISGASPLINGTLLMTPSLIPLQRNSDGTLQASNASETVMSSASPELRRQLDLAVAQTNGPQRLQAALSLSDEPDYRSQHAKVRSEFHFNEQHTTFAVGAAYTSSRINADIAGPWLPYVTTTGVQATLLRSGSAAVLQATSTDRSFDFALTQVLNRGALIDIGFSVREAQGYLENPYRAMSVVFVDPSALVTPAGTQVRGDMRALLEQRPDTRRTQAASVRYVQHIAPFNAALHVDYDYSRDDWELESHAIELQWLQPIGEWQLAPRLRWYSQSAAWFHQSHLVSLQRYRGIARDGNGNEIWLNANDTSQRYLRTVDGRYLDAAGKELDPALLDLLPQFSNFSPALLPAQYSSDPRLAGYGVVSAGISLQRRFGNGLLLSTGIDRYRRASSLQFNGNGDSSYADFDYMAASLAVTLDLQTVARRQQQTHNHAMHGNFAALPAGMMLAHDGAAAGTFATGYRLHHQYDMTMHMLDFSWHPADHWTLLLMPQFMTFASDAGHSHAGGIAGSMPASSFADTLLAAQWQLPAGNGEWQVSAGVGIPTTGTGSADVMPALQYRAQSVIGQWGVRLNGRSNIESRHASDYDPSRSAELSVWLARPLTSSVTATVRALEAREHFDATGSASTTAAGIGASMMLGSQMLSLEWLVPLATHGDGGHLHDHSLFARWHLAL